MKRSLLISCGLIITLMLLLSPKTMSAAPQEQSGDDEMIQIVLVLDVSGSMGTPVYTGIVPEDLLSLLLRMDELQNDPGYARLIERVEEADNNPEVMEARQDSQDAYEVLQKWITREHGIDLQGNHAIISSLLKEAGCNDSSSGVISTASTIDKIEFYVDWDCPIGLGTPALVEKITAQVPYLDDPEYQTIREVWQQALLIYDEALETSGYNSLSQQLDEYKSSGVYTQVQNEIDQLVAKYNIPSRLELAKSAALNLIDYTQLVKNNTGWDSYIGLVTFSNQPMYKHGLTLEHELLKPLIQSMVPLQQTNIGDSLIMGLNELESNEDPDIPQLLILLSDGHANVGMTSSEILAVIPPRANNHDVIICTAGFADIETEVDFVLLEGLAYETNGEYLFTNSGAELASFFTACREAAVGKELAGQLTGIVVAGDFIEAGRVDIPVHTCGLSLSLNFLSGMPAIELVDPDGKTIDPTHAGVTYQAQNQVQLLTVENPPAGEWIINLENEDSEGEDAVYSLVISTNPCEGPAPEAAQEESAELPYFVSDSGLPVITAAIVIVIVLLAGATAYIIVIRQRRA